MINAFINISSTDQVQRTKKLIKIQMLSSVAIDYYKLIQAEVMLSSTINNNNNIFSGNWDLLVSIFNLEHYTNSNSNAAQPFMYNALVNGKRHLSIIID